MKSFAGKKLHSVICRLESRVYILSKKGRDQRRCVVEFFLVDLARLPVSIYIYLFPEEVIVIKHSAARIWPYAFSLPFLPSKTTASRGVNQITEAKRAEEKNPIFPARISAVCRKMVGNGGIRSPRSARLCRDPRNADRTGEKNFIPTMQNSACMPFYRSSLYLSISIFVQLIIYIGLKILAIPF